MYFCKPNSSLEFSIRRRCSYSSSTKGKPEANDEVTLFPIPNIDLSVRAFGENCQAIEAYFFDFVRTSDGEMVARPGNVQIYAVDNKGYELLSHSFQGIQGLKTTLDPVPEDTYMVNAGDKLHVYVDRILATEFLMPMHRV